MLQLDHEILRMVGEDNWPRNGQADYLAGNIATQSDAAVKRQQPFVAPPRLRKDFRLDAVQVLYGRTRLKRYVFNPDSHGSNRLTAAVEPEEIGIRVISRFICPWCANQGRCRPPMLQRQS